MVAVYGLPSSANSVLGRYRASVIASQPLMYWPMDETSGTVLKDVVGGVDATLSGSYTLAAQGPGALSRAVSFTGGSASTGSPKAPSINAWSWECWFACSVASPNATPFVNQRNPSSALALNLILGPNGGSGGSQGKPQFLLDSNGIALGCYTTAGLYNGGAWYHWVATWSDPTNANLSGGQMLNYLNGALIPSTTADSAGSTTVPFASGATSIIFGTLNPIKLCHVAAYSRALTATEALRHYTLGAPNGA